MVKISDVEFDHPVELVAETAKVVVMVMNVVSLHVVVNSMLDSELEAAVADSVHSVVSDSSVQVLEKSNDVLDVG
jgi:hypothetical protein